MPITPWLYYADPPLAPICRSRAGSNMPVGDTPDEKERFATLARARGLSEAALALSAIRAVIATDSDSLDSYARSEKMPATDRITVRLRPGDGEAIVRRAEQRGMKASTYLAALVRGHVVANPPLAVRELAALKQSVVVLAALGRVLARTYLTPGVSQEDLQRIRAALTDLEQRTHDLARAALISWETRSD
jgi:hypothetical protein